MQPQLTFYREWRNSKLHFFLISRSRQIWKNLIFSNRVKDTRTGNRTQELYQCFTNEAVKADNWSVLCRSTFLSRAYGLS